LSHPIYLAVKTKGERSLLGKRKGDEVARNLFRKTRVLWQERNCPKPNLHVVQTPTHRKASETDAFCCIHVAPRCMQLLTEGDRPMRPAKGMNGLPNGCYRLIVTYHGIAYGSRGLGRRSLHSTRGGNVPPRNLGKPGAGEREAGNRGLHCHRLQGREMRKSLLIPRAKTDVSGEPCARKPASTVRKRGVGKGLERVPRPLPILPIQKPVVAVPPVVVQSRTTGF
jgi:hypothetical protein